MGQLMQPLFAAVVVSGGGVAELAAPLSVAVPPLRDWSNSPPTVTRTSPPVSFALIARTSEIYSEISIVRYIECTQWGSRELLYTGALKQDCIVTMPAR